MHSEQIQTARLKRESLLLFSVLDHNGLLQSLREPEAVQSLFHIMLSLCRVKALTEMLIAEEQISLGACRAPLYST